VAIQHFDRLSAKSGVERLDCFVASLLAMTDRHEQNRFVGQNNA